MAVGRYPAARELFSEDARRARARREPRVHAGLRAEAAGADRAPDASHARPDHGRRDHARRDHDHARWDDTRTDHARRDDPWRDARDRHGGGSPARRRDLPEPGRAGQREARRGGRDRPGARRDRGRRSRRRRGTGGAGRAADAPDRHRRRHLRDRPRRRSGRRRAHARDRRRDGLPRPDAERDHRRGPADPDALPSHAGRSLAGLVGRAGASRRVRAHLGRVRAVRDRESPSPAWTAPAPSSLAGAPAQTTCVGSSISSFAPRCRRRTHGAPRARRAPPHSRE